MMTNQLILYLKKFCTNTNYYVLFLVLFFITPVQSYQPEIQSTPGNPIRYSAIDKEIRTVIVDNYFPYTFVNEKGEPDGLSVELIKAVSQELGMDLRVEVNTWNNSLDMLLAGEVDALSIMAYSEERDKIFNFSAPYTIAFDAYFTRKNNSRIFTSMDLKEKKIIVNKKDQAHDYLKTLPFITENHFIYESNTAKALRLLSSGKGDIAVMPKVLGLVLIKKLKIKNLVLDPPIIQDYERPFSFAVKEGNVGLLERLENGLQIIKENGKYQQIHDKWFGAYEHDEISFAKILKRFFWFIFAFILIAGVLLLWTFMLRRQVALRTRHLEVEITERNQTEKKLQEMQKLFEAAIDHSPSGILIADAPDVNIRIANQAALGIRGEDKKMLTGIDMIKHSINWQTFQANGTPHPSEMLPLSRAVLKGEITQNEELILRDQKGIDHWISSNAAPIRNSDGKIIAGIVIFHDITERKQAEDALQKEKATLKTIFENNPHGIAVINKKGKYLFINQMFTKITGYTLQEVKTGRKWFEKAYPNLKYRNTVIEKWHKDRLREEMGKDFRFNVTCKNGLIKSIEFRTTYLEDYSISVLTDISARKQAEKALKESEAQLHQVQKMESIGTLAGGIAHDFNNILFPIIGHSEMLIEDAPEGSPLRDGLNQIYTSALRAKAMVKQILTFSRQEIAELKLMKMQPIIKEALKLIRSTIPTTIEIKQDIQTDCGAVKADPTQIHQIVMNLATNAYHAMEETGGELNVRLKEVDFGELDLFNPDIKLPKYARLSISDTGKGLDKDTIKKIFDPFFTTKEIGKGTGMGLSVVHGVVKSMNGTIKVNSSSDKGTEFHIYLPLAETLKEQQQTNNVASSIQNGTEHILLVDDENIVATVVQQMLERLGYQVTVRTSSIEALEVFRVSSDKFDIVITDMQMPNMPGNKLSVELTKIRPDIPILLCTGFSETMSEEKAKSLGINGFLLKPIVIKDLSRKIREVLDKN